MELVKYDANTDISQYNVQIENCFKTIDNKVCELLESNTEACAEKVKDYIHWQNAELEKNKLILEKAYEKSPKNQHKVIKNKLLLEISNLRTELNYQKSINSGLEQENKKLRGLLLKSNNELLFLREKMAKNYKENACTQICLENLYHNLQNENEEKITKITKIAENIREILIQKFSVFDLLVDKNNEKLNISPCKLKPRKSANSTNRNYQKMTKSQLIKLTKNEQNSEKIIFRQFPRTVQTERKRGKNKSQILFVKNMILS